MFFGAQRGGPTVVARREGIGPVLVLQRSELFGKRSPFGCPSIRPSIEHSPGKKSEIEIPKLKTNPRREGGNPNPLASSLVSSLVSLSSCCLSVAAGGGFLFCHVPSQVPPPFNHSPGCYLPHAALKPWEGGEPRVRIVLTYNSLGLNVYHSTE